MGASPEDGDEQQLSNVRGVSVAAVSSHPTNANSLDASDISGNTITNFESAFAKVIVGIDTQCLSQSVLVSNNKVNLKEGVGTETDDKYIASRVRKFASMNNIIQSNNKFDQEEFVEVVEEETETGRRELLSHPFVENEWEYGGCPFGRA